MNQLGVTAWAGLGLFFVGMRMISTHVRQLGGGSFHTFMVRSLGRPLAPQSVGLMFGALTQSTGAVTFVTSGLVAAGALTLERALPMLSWANVGTSALVLLAAVNIHSMVLLLLGIVGLSFFLGIEQSDRYRHVVFALLGLGLLLFGLTMLKGSMASLGSEPWMREFVEFSGSGVAIALVAGFVIAVAVQSSSIVTVLALPLVHEGLLSLDQTVLMIYGASVGSGFAVLLLASGMEGTSRQLSLCQAVLRAMTALVLLPLFFIEKGTGVPLVLALLRAVSDAPATQCAVAYVLFQVILVLTSQISARWLLGLARKLAPPSLEEMDRFLSATIRANPDMADIDLVFAARSRLQTLRPLQAALHQFSSELIGVPVADRPEFAAHMVEGLHAILMVAADTATDDSADAVEMLFILTEERSALMERVREELLGGGASLGGRESLLSATLTFERIIWLLRRLAPPPPAVLT